MSDKTPLYEQLDVASYIVTVRGQKVILDADLARIYGVTTKALNQAVKMGVFVVRAVIWSAAASGIPRDAAFRVRAGKRCRTSFVTALQNTDAPRSMCA
ncbi:MAG: ORF6N domain-containing protein [Kiritimatiellae bacterium]|nr:ORF6N domain-containing protein [Kiritimatiellia bacterium]